MRTMEKRIKHCDIFILTKNRIVQAMCDTNAVTYKSWTSKKQVRKNIDTFENKSKDHNPEFSLEAQMIRVYIERIMQRPRSLERTLMLEGKEDQCKVDTIVWLLRLNNNNLMTNNNRKKITYI